MISFIHLDRKYRFFRALEGKHSALEFWEAEKKKIYIKRKKLDTSLWGLFSFNNLSIIVFQDWTNYIITITFPIFITFHIAHPSLEYFQSHIYGLQLLALLLLSALDGFSVCAQKIKVRVTGSSNRSVL